MLINVTLFGIFFLGVSYFLGFLNVLKKKEASGLRSGSSSDPMESVYSLSFPFFFSASLRWTFLVILNTPNWLRRTWYSNRLSVGPLESLGTTAAKTISPSCLSVIAFHGTTMAYEVQVLKDGACQIWSTLPTLRLGSHLL